MRLEDFCSTVPRIQQLPEYDMRHDGPHRGITAFFYDGADYKGQKTKVFAHIGFPEMKQGEKVPAIVLIHGGGGHAFPEWIRLWNEKGFAAIAMDTTGFVPREDLKGTLTTETRTMRDDYVHELYGSLAEDCYVLGPDKSDMRDFDLPMDEQWMYHAVADTILAHNILRNDDRIDSTKIGIAGISWGSVIAAIAIGYDTRYAFAVPIYGSGYLDSTPTPKLPSIFGHKQVKELWSAADRFNKVKFPVLWKNWVYDVAFSIVAASRSYQATKENGAVLSTSINMSHSHIDAWNSPEAYRFAEGVVNSYLPLIRVEKDPENFGEISFDISVPQDFEEVSATVYYLTHPIEYGEDNRLTHFFEGVAARIESGTVYADIPADACCYFVGLKGKHNGTEYISNTAIVTKQ